MKVERLAWCPCKVYHDCGKEYMIQVEASLNDDCKNKTCDFSITASVYEKRRNGSLKFDNGGCIHEIIVKHFPELKKFVSLHLCNYLGQPMYPEANGQYFVREKGIKIAMEKLRCTQEEFTYLSYYCDQESRPYFKYLLFKLGLVERWKQEADEFIKFLEEKTGNEWVNPYKPEEEIFVLRMTDEEKNEIEKNEKEDYWSIEKVRARAEEILRQKNETIRLKVIEECKKSCKKATDERDVMLYILDCGLSIDNVIFYNNTKKVVFNWLDYKPKISQETFVDFVNNVDYSKLPENVTFQFGKEEKK